MADPSPHDWLEALPVREILLLCKGAVSFTCAQRSSKTLMLDRILDKSMPRELITMLTWAAQERCDIDEGPGWQRKKRQIIVVEKADETHEDDAEAPVLQGGRSVEICTSCSPTRYLKLPTHEELQSSYQAFHKATMAASLTTSICAVCACKCRPLDEKVNLYDLKDLPNSHHLKPWLPHPHHNLHDGMLLEGTGVEQTSVQIKVTCCQSCFDNLKKKKDLPPRFTLSNNLWIGPIPWVLQVLTLPEQLLISLIYPWVFVFKLFPKKAGRVGDLSQMQRAM